jgi:hypothetical protein
LRQKISIQLGDGNDGFHVLIDRALNSIRSDRDTFEKNAAANNEKHRAWRHKFYGSFFDGPFGDFQRRVYHVKFPHLFG